MKHRGPTIEVETLPTYYIESADQFEVLVDQLCRVPRIAFDTEFVRDRHYTPLLELVQIATDDLVAVIDYRRQPNLRPLFEVLYDEAVLKVAHASRQDLEILYHLTHRIPQPWFDIQIAAAVTGLGTQLGFAHLVDRLLGVKLEKAQTLSNWSRRPLTAAQIEYALNDVRYLLPLHDELERRLRAGGRLEWFIHDMERYTAPYTFAQPDVREVWREVEGASRLTRQQLAVLRELATWREAVARRHNRALPFVARDGALLYLARRQPTTREPAELYRVRGLHRWSVEHYATEIIAAIERGQRIPPDERPRYDRATRPLTEDESALVTLMENWVQTRAKEHGVAPSILASHDELRALVRSHGDQNGLAELPVLQGWRQAVVGDELIALMEGKAVLSWNSIQGRLELQRNSSW